MSANRAVVIGINYTKFPASVSAAVSSRAGLNPLRYAEADAHDMASVLEESGYIVESLTGPMATREAIIATLRKQKLAAIESDGFLLVYFAGHGDVDPDDAQMAYLLPANGDPQDMPTTAIPLQDVVERHLKKVNRALTLFDCCHSGYTVGVRGTGLTHSNDRAARDFRDIASRTFSRAQASVVLAACGGDQLARELEHLGHGAFTYYILDWWRTSRDIEESSLWSHIVWGLERERLPSPVRGGVQAGHVILRASSHSKTGPDVNEPVDEHVVSKPAVRRITRSHKNTTRPVAKLRKAPDTLAELHVELSSRSVGAIKKIGREIKDVAPPMLRGFSVVFLSTLFVVLFLSMLFGVFNTKPKVTPTVPSVSRVVPSVTYPLSTTFPLTMFAPLPITVLVSRTFPLTISASLPLPVRVPIAVPTINSADFVGSCAFKYLTSTDKGRISLQTGNEAARSREVFLSTEAGVQCRAMMPDQIGEVMVLHGLPVPPSGITYIFELDSASSSEDSFSIELTSSDYTAEYTVKPHLPQTP